MKLASEWAGLDQRGKVAQFDRRPFGRNFRQPFDAGGFEFGVGVEASGDGAVDEDGFLLVEEFDLALLLGNQGVDLRRFLIEEGDDAVLFCS